MDFGQISSSSGFNDGSMSSGSSLASPYSSPKHSPYGSPTGDPHTMSLRPPNTSGNKSTTNTFVHKLYNMIIDHQYQHLIAWNFTGTTFIVCNIVEFARDVLPKHFKHNNFSSFVRQLNMYGFHKVNKSPRGHRTLAENQIWEFSHPKFQKDRLDLLDDIKRKTIENDMARRDLGSDDMSSRIAVMQVSQTAMMQQLASLQENFSHVVQELAETRRQQGTQQQMLKNMMDFLTQQQGMHIQFKPDPERPPSIYITSPDMVPQSRSSAPLTVQTQDLNLAMYAIAPNTSPGTSANTSPRTVNPDDEINSLYSPHSPHTPRGMSVPAQHPQQPQLQQPTSYFTFTPHQALAVGNHSNPSMPSSAYTFAPSPC